MEQLLGEIIVAVLALAGSLVGNHFSNRKSQALMEYRLDQLEKKVTLHNNVVERVYELEKDMAVHEDKINVANHRIKNLERVS